MLELRLAGEKHAHAEECRGGGEVRQVVPQEVHLCRNLIVRQRCGDVHLRVKVARDYVIWVTCGESDVCRGASVKAKALRLR